MPRTERQVRECVGHSSCQPADGCDIINSASSSRQTRRARTPCHQQRRVGRVFGFRAPLVLVVFIGWYVSLLLSNYNRTCVVQAVRLGVGLASSADSWKQKAFNSLKAYCTNEELQKFVKCKKDEKTGDYDIKAGTFGAGVFADLLNIPEQTNTHLFANCPGTPKQQWIPQLSDQCRIDARQQSSVKVFLKILQETAERENKMGGDRPSNISAFKKEVQRTRGAGALRWRGTNIPMSPRLIETGTLVGSVYTPHWMQTASYSQELVSGADAVDVRTHIFRVEEFILYKAVMQLKSSGGQWNQQMEGLVAEFWGHFRTYFRLLDSIMGIMIEMHSQLVLHCDLHLKNLMVLKEDLSPQELERRKADGTVVQPVGGGAAYILEPTKMMVIDTAYMMSVNVRKQGKLIHFKSPCLMHRVRRPEDINELWRSGLSGMMFYKEKEPFDKLVERMQQKDPQGIGQIIRTDGFRKLRQEYNNSRQLITELVQRSKQVKEMADCQVTNTKVFVNNDDRAIREAIFNHKQTESDHLIPTDCSVGVQKAGITKIREINNQVMQKIPNFARMAQPAPSPALMQGHGSIEAPPSSPLAGSQSPSTWGQVGYRDSHTGIMRPPNSQLMAQNPYLQQQAAPPPYPTNQQQQFPQMPMPPQGFPPPYPQQQQIPPQHPGYPPQQPGQSRMGTPRSGSVRGGSVRGGSVRGGSLRGSMRGASRGGSMRGSGLSRRGSVR